MKNKKEEREERVKKKKCLDGQIKIREKQEERKKKIKKPWTSIFR